MARPSAKRKGCGEEGVLHEAAEALLGLVSAVPKRGRVGPMLMEDPPERRAVRDLSADCSAPVPEHVLTILLREFIASDAQLSAFSNVCRMWRRKAAEVAAKEATMAVVEKNRGEGEAAEEAGLGLGAEKKSRFLDLLLPDMARTMLQRRVRTLPASAGAGSAVDRAAGSSGGLFCLAWFAPSGIRTTEVYVEHEYDDGAGPYSFKEVVADERDTECCYEWRGYRKPLEICSPFGYAECFLADVFKATINEGIIQNLLPCSTMAAMPDLLRDVMGASAWESDDHRPTIAVRGATLARPEGHCLCLDEDYVRKFMTHPLSLRPAPLSQEHTMPSSISQMKDRFQDRMTELMPRVVCGSLGSGEGPLKRGIQFLNADKSHTARLITPYFECGRVNGPVTIFLVVKSAEDGCWVSGRNSRFEVGHLYNIIGESPVPTLIGNSDEGDLSDDDEEAEPPFQCLCCFKSDDPFRLKHLSEEVPGESRIHRGSSSGSRTTARCYCAVFDGANSLIRVDGRTDAQKKVSRADHGHGTTEHDPEENGRLVGSGVLDGLSLGADHQFDYSLMCDIEGSSTVLYELAVFKGRMNGEDIEQMEYYLMNEHGIVPS